ncbi:NAD-dependent protein deacetylase [Oceanospirillum beijerinckii]|uniref:NAD-dependent protein deacetylase n=1 Tax=Oceanospirillum beijerinckii TaxID=64976 RepID=UPI0003F6079A|nr:NAD-dependent protein deacetylase [Oceanospirillum beijerinckii]
MTTLKASERLQQFIQDHPRLMLLTGAGISTDSGIPDYRDKSGQWKRKPPVQHHDFMSDLHTRQRFWARSLIGWPVMRNAQPNAAHKAIAQLEHNGTCQLLVTQNVDGLHNKAGSQNVVDLHGRSDQVICMGCQVLYTRDQICDQLSTLNPEFAQLTASAAPDGDADLERDDFHQFQLTDCQQCGGILKPHVVFFGDTVPRDRVDTAFDALEQSDGLLVIGSSLMVFSGYRFCRKAHELGKPIALLNKGVTRADELATLKLDAACSETLAGLDQ